ncbi:MAG: DNA polymerase III subunit alpha, partial [Clostridia bacterium]|nr:DNA polymerase III subunit alpha [Clostridia bacterium]
MSDFVHLHLHSEYSLLDGACRVADIPKKAKAMGHTAAAITDHGVLYGAVAFYKACKEEGIKPIIGCEVYVARRSMQDRDRERDSKSYHLVLLAENETGYRNLIWLVSKAYTDGFYAKPRIDLELLQGHTEGLIALSACLAGFIPQSILAGEYEKAEEHARQMQALFGEDHYYLEIQNHGLDDDKVVCEGILALSQKTGIPMVATNDVHYLNRQDADTQAILMCVQTGNVITDGRPIGFETNEFYYKSTAEMEALFGAFPGAIENTVKIAERCQFDYTFGEVQLPRYTPENGMEPTEYLRSLAIAGLERKIASGAVVPDEKYSTETYRDRIEYELSVIHQMGYSEYYLVVWDFVNHAKEQGIPVGPGRGSGAGSLVAYLIGITDIDSLKFDLLFERFLNPERVSMPDFDIDFCYDRRDEAIAYVREKYGEDHTAQIITFGTLAARAAVKDVGRAMGMSIPDVDNVAKKIPRELGITLDKAMEANRELRDLYEEDPQVKKLLDTAKALEGMPRHASTHAAGVVITERPLTEYVPIAVNSGVTVTQFDMDTVAELGLLKFDFLALRYLTILRSAEDLIREKEPEFDLTRVDITDAKTYEAISAGKTDGVFQLESEGMRQMLTQLKPSCLDDIIAAIALYRPGPMDSIPKYIEARRHRDTIRYASPALAPILDVTYGCIVYQEQVMQIFREIAGYTFGHADVVRRAISKKKQGVLEKEREAFLAGAVENGMREEDASDLFEDIVSFANYAFNKSHAAAYAVLSFRTAYLRTHYPLEYNCALLTSVLSQTGKLNEYITECARRGIKVLPPDINKSRAHFHAEGNCIRFGLVALKNVGLSFINAFLKERETHGEFLDFADLVERMYPIELNNRQVEYLIKSGAMDNLGAFRSQLLTV